MAVKSIITNKKDKKWYSVYSALLAFGKLQ